MPRSEPEPVLLSGGNPQIPKGDGEQPVRDYLAAMPGWKREVGRRLDEVIGDAVPGVRKAVRWNSPFYGVEGRGWFVSYRCFTNYVKVTFFVGAALKPEPPVSGKDPDARAAHYGGVDDIDDARLREWIAQAAAMPGWDGF